MLQLERCLSDPTDEYRRTLAFLGLREWLPLPEVLQSAEDIVAEPGTAAPPDEPDYLIATLELDVLLLRSLVPDIDLSLWPSFRHLA